MLLDGLADLLAPMFEQEQVTAFNEEPSLRFSAGVA